MSNRDFFPLRLVKPEFDDSLTDLILDLDHQRKFVLGGTTPPHLFYQLKQVFHIFETLGSARIEGNRTTIAEWVDREVEGRSSGESVEEILSIERALAWLESLWSKDTENFRIDHVLVRELHRMVTGALSVAGEGDATPGAYRTTAVRISGADHQPPEPSDVQPLMDDLFAFLAKEDPGKYDLIKIALAHHRFTWIHPFANGNGRTVRLLTYALLLKTGFRVGGDLPVARLVNPTAIFCSDRSAYYAQLARADQGDDEGLLSWCRYVLKGLQTELDKVNKLLDYQWLGKNVLEPAIMELHQKNGISDRERGILLKTLSTPLIKNSDIRTDISQVQTSRILAELKKRKLLVTAPDAERKYHLGIHGSPLMRTVIRQLDRLGFLPIKGEL
ncbi:MAG: Fic family protein [Spirochaetia bacterium]|nr:Fic family protein [Spirochaetia bacterium]